MSRPLRHHRVTSGSYDIRSQSIWRVLRQDLRFRFIPIGNFGGGPNLLYIARLLILHTFGACLIGLYIRSGLVRRLAARLSRK